MSLNIVPLHKRRVNAHVVEYIEELLSDARNGTLDQIAVVSFRCDQEAREFMYIKNNPYEMLALLNILSNRLNNQLQEPL